MILISESRPSVIKSGLHLGNAGSYEIERSLGDLHERRRLGLALLLHGDARAALSLAYGAGLRASEVISLKLADIDSERTCLREAAASLRRRQVVIRVEQGKGRMDRYAMLSGDWGPPRYQRSLVSVRNLMRLESKKRS